MNEFDWLIKCPVPREQRPFYEYLKQKESSLMGWVALNQKKYTKRFFTVLVIFFIIFFPITFLTTAFYAYPIEGLFLNLILALSGLGILYTYILTGWFYAARRLKDAKVSYEESGWHDGRIWIKPPTILKHERLLYHYQLLPLITRIKKTLLIIVLTLFVINLIFFFFFY